MPDYEERDTTILKRADIEQQEFEVEPPDRETTNQNETLVVEIIDDLISLFPKCHDCGSVKPRDIASGQVIKSRGLSGIQQVGSISSGNPSIARLQIASGWDLSGYQKSGTRQDRVKDETLKSDLGKPALYA